MQRITQKPIHEAFNDGFMYYGHEITIRESGKKVGVQFTEEGKLAYKLLNASAKDFDIAGLKGFRLDLKVKTLFPPSFRNVSKVNLKCVIDGTQYDVINVDWDSDQRYLFFLLQEIGVVK